MSNRVVLTKAGPRLIDLYLDVDQLTILVNGPGMLFEKLELMTNRSAIEGANVAFYERMAAGLEGTVDCPHEPLRRAAISVEPHRLGAELAIDLGAASMYQSELRLRTTTGGTFRQLIDDSLGVLAGPFAAAGPTLAVLVAVRATGHHEHHDSAGAALRRNAERQPEKPREGDGHPAAHSTGHSHDHGGH